MALTKGNSCLLVLQKIANIALLIVSLAFIAIGVYMTVNIKEASVIPITFMVIGVLEIILSFVTICNSTSRNVMSCYFYTLLALIGLQAVAAITGYFMKDQIIKWAGENHSSDSQAANDFENLIRNDIDIALYVAVAASAIQVLCLLINYCYQKSMKRVLTDSDRRLMSDSYYENEERFNEKKEREKLARKKEEIKAKYRAEHMNYREMMNNP